MVQRQSTIVPYLLKADANFENEEDWNVYSTIYPSGGYNNENNRGRSKFALIIGMYV